MVPGEVRRGHQIPGTEVTWLPHHTTLPSCTVQPLLQESDKANPKEKPFEETEYASEPEGMLALANGGGGGSRLLSQIHC